MNIAFTSRNGAAQQVGVALCVVLTMGCSAIAKDSTMPSPAEARHIAEDCAPLLRQSNARHALQLVSVLVQSQGMRLVAQACPFVQTAGGQMQQVLDVRVQVVDSETASNFVRGPLADGEEVDMGDVHMALPALAHKAAAAQEEDVSPDVQFNRSWLAGVMRGRGWKGVSGHWWAFVPAATSR